MTTIPAVGTVRGHRRVTGAVLRQAVGWALTAVLVVVWFLLLRPQAIGGPAAYIGVSGISMTPTMHNGDMAVVERAPSYRVGDIVAYRVPAGEPGAGSNVIHRIVAGNGIAGFVTKGDHNAYTDHFWHPRSADVIGKVWFHLPGVADQLGRLHSPPVLALLVGVMTFAIIAWPNRPSARGSAHPGGTEEGGPGLPPPLGASRPDGCRPRRGLRRGHRLSP